MLHERNAMDEESHRSESGGSADIRKDVTRVLTERGDAIVSDSVGIFPYSGPQPLETDYCERLGRKLLGLLCAGVESRLDAEANQLSATQRLVTDRSLPLERLFTFVYLLERTVLDELALTAT